MQTAVAALLTLPHALRLLGGSRRAIATYDGLLPSAHYVPGIGDAIAGALAIVLGIAILRVGVTNTLSTLLIAWNVYGALDLCIAIPINVLYPPADPQFFTPVLATSFLALHIVSLVLLFRALRTVRAAPARGASDA